jgi:hypothetical protein
MRGKRSVAACRQWLEILIVVLNDEETVMRNGEERLQSCER